jgi:hypothetical protein
MDGNGWVMGGSGNGWVMGGNGQGIRLNSVMLDFLVMGGSAW